MFCLSPSSCFVQTPPNWWLSRPFCLNMEMRASSSTVFPPFKKINHTRLLSRKLCAPCLPLQYVNPDWIPPPSQAQSKRVQSDEYSRDFRYGTTRLRLMSSLPCVSSHHHFSLFPPPSSTGYPITERERQSARQFSQEWVVAFVFVFLDIFTDSGRGM